MFTLRILLGVRKKQNRPIKDDAVIDQTQRSKAAHPVQRETWVKAKRSQPDLLKDSRRKGQQHACGQVERNRPIPAFRPNWEFAGEPEDEECLKRPEIAVRQLMRQSVAPADRMLTAAVEKIKLMRGVQAKQSPDSE